MSSVVPGVSLTVQETNDISEGSNMARPLCVELTSVSGGLERGVEVNLVFIGQGYAMMCKDLQLLYRDANLSSTFFSQVNGCWLSVLE